MAPGTSLYLGETDADRAAQGFPADQRPAPSLGRIYRLFCGDGGDLKAYLKELASRAHLSKDCRTAFSNLISLADQTFTSVIGSFQEPLHIFLNPILDAATSGDDFDLRTRTTSHGQSGSVSYAEMEERRALMLPQELKTLSPEEEIIFVQGIAHPITCSKIRYYKDGFFKARLKGKAKVPVLVLHDEEAQPAAAAAAAAAAPVGTADAVQSRQQATSSPPPSDMQEQDMINLGKWFRRSEPISKPTNADRLVSGELPPPPIPPRIREHLKDYPDHLDQIQKLLIEYVKQPMSMPLDGAIWTLKGRLDSNYVEALGNLEKIKKHGDAEAIAAAEKKLYKFGCAASGSNGLLNVHDLVMYFDQYKDYFK